MGSICNCNNGKIINSEIKVLQNNNKIRQKLLLYHEKTFNSNISNYNAFSPKMIFKDKYLPTSSNNEFNSKINKHSNLYKNNTTVNFIPIPLSFGLSADKEDNLTSINKELNKIEKEKIKKILKSHNLFSFMEEDDINLLINEKLKFFQVINNKQIFLEGCEGKGFYIILSGECQIYKTGSDSSIFLDAFQSFGDLSLIDEEILKAYSVYCIKECELAVILTKDYKELINNKYKLYLNDYHIFYKILSNIPLFNNLEKKELVNLSKLSSYRKEKENSSFDIENSFFFVEEGQLIINKNENDNNENEENIYEKNSYYGLISLILNNNSDEDKKLVFHCKCKRKSSIYLLSKRNIVEVLGIDFSFQIIYPYFKKVMMSDNFFNKLFNELQLNPIYNLFEIKKYSKNEVVYDKKNRGKIIIILEGQLKYKSNHEKIKFIFGKVYGTGLIKNDVILENPVYSENMTIVFESYWEKLKAKIKDLNSEINKIMNKLNMFYILRKSFNESKLIEIASIIKKKTYNKNEIIYKKNKKSKNEEIYFYLVYKGEVRKNNKDKIIDTFGIGNSFGELALLGELNDDDEFIASQDNTKLFLIDKNYFFDLISDSKFNDKIKHKIGLEDFELDIKDIYINNKLDGNIYLVNSNYEKYTAIVYSKNEENKVKLEKEIFNSKRLDHLFIRKFVKYFEYENKIIILYEYYDNILNKDLSKYLIEGKNISYKKKVIKFICGCFICVLKYLHSKHLILGNLNLKNFIIDNEGYIKLINFTECHRYTSFNNNDNTTKEETFCSSHFNSSDKNSYKENKKEKNCYFYDYWCLGLNLYYIYFNKCPFNLTLDDLENINKLKEIYNKEMEIKIPEDCDSDIKELLESLLIENRISSDKDFQNLNIFNDTKLSEYIQHKIISPFFNESQMDSFSIKKKEKFINYLIKEYFCE